MLQVTRAGRSSDLPLSPGLHSVGGGGQCDLVILGIEPEPAFNLVYSAGADANLLVEALRDGLTVGGRLLEPGDQTSLACGEVIRFSDVECVVQGLAARGARRQNWPMGRRILAAGLLAAAAALLFGLQDNPPAPSKTTEAHVLPEPPLTAEDIVAELREALRLARLPLEVAIASDRSTVRVGAGSPKLPLETRLKLQGILSAVERHSPLPIVDMTSLSSGLSGFVAAVGYTPVKFIIGADGKRYREGEFVSGEWRIEQIQAGRMIVARGGERDVISFEPKVPAMDLRLARAPEGGGT
ncbi:hypothetical protein SJ05684_b47760 (plasmid) [Sinorhizobium sojae CCBAU 05684]|uniref:YscD/Y4YQ C-terminal domain-containing protein n=1 Tax=Sinorhizobium sojae CCBAU 05684 TaxID=716928 RepID=A0A249PIL9_9HYPH|nr:hypothetical protein SJ05684_b47760 [Sinorhizobium sojae CCBAU 05684]